MPIANPTLSLAEAKSLIAAALAKGAELGLKPLTVAVLDNGGHLKALERQDGASLLRPQVAQGKAYGALCLGLGSRALHKRAEEQAYFVNAVNALADGALVPVAGGVLVRDAAGAILGAVGITGDTSDNDEACAVTAIVAAGFTADAG
ncbi:MAG TPA: heme-binding protein [Gammaproteobacteria bacterium]